ncbi:F-box family protein, putative [Theobroma cacao]|uniref:F-box family protein, putative n=1 Tax=Theobroma cacao TaxID=3641 RepID=A0A061FMH4_THECC|nr:F-box family protein, putative [Theobroma cacao]
MGKKRRIKKSNQLKQGHDPDVERPLERSFVASVHDVTMEDAVTAISSFVDDCEQDRPRNKWGLKVELGHAESCTSLPLAISLVWTWLDAGGTMLQYKEIKILVSNINAREPHKLVVLDCPQLESVRFEGSNLTSFQYRGRLVLFEFELSSNDDRPIFPNWSPSPFKFQLNDAMLDFRRGPPIYNSFNCNGFKLILKSVKNVNSLTLCRWVFQALISLVLSSLSRDSEIRLYGLTEMWWIDYSMDRDNFNSLLSFLKLCPCLERLHVTIDPESYNMGSTKQCTAKVNGLRKLNHLKPLKLEGFANENKEILFAKRLRPFFRMKPVILAKSKGTCLRRLVKELELEKEGKDPYKFKEVKNFYETCHDHAHMKF